MKKIINKPDEVVGEMLNGLAAANPDLKYIEEYGVISRKKKSVKVGVVSGGGSGHEPAHAGYVGRGMLDAAVSGNVFASPSPDRILCGIREANQGKGVLLIIKNYSGDVMNFEMAQELAEMEGIKVERVIVRDDVSVPDSDVSTRRRGIAGTVLVHKIAGAAAEKGYGLAEVKRIAEKAILNIRSMGVAMSSCTIPAVGKPGFYIGEEEIEVGMGIHGEPGISRLPMVTAEELAEILLEKILLDMDYSGARVGLMVNGLGATTYMELCILNGEVNKILRRKGIEIVRTFVGNYMTALEMAGCSISLLKLDDEMLEMLDAPCDVEGFHVRGNAK